MYRILTDLTVILHLLFIIFVIAGGFFARRKRWMTIIHLGAVAWGIYAELAPGVICPLTTLENYYAQLAGISTYEEDFITRYLVPIIYQDSLTSTIQLVLVVIVILLNVMAYKSIWTRSSSNQNYKI